MRLMGLTDEQRLAIEQASGGTIKTEAAQILTDIATTNAVQAVEDQVNKSLKEVQGLIGPHGSVTNLKAGGIQISRGTGISASTDGVQKTTIDPQGNLFVGSDLTFPQFTSMCVFVNEYIYNGEQFGAGDLLIGDNSTGQANLKYDASAGKLEFRYGVTVNVYIDTDGTLRAGAGVVQMDTDGIQITVGSTMSDVNAYTFKNTQDVRSGMYSWVDSDVIYLGVWNQKPDFIMAFKNDPGFQSYMHFNETFKYDVDYKFFGTSTTPIISIDGGLNKAYYNGIEINGEVVTNANDIFRCNSCATSTFVATIATLPGGANLTYTLGSGAKNVIVPAATTQLAKMRLYNTTRGTSALISDSVGATSTITLTANVPAGWQLGDTITVASQTVSGGGINWVDLEITSGELLNKTNVSLWCEFADTGGAGQTLLTHPFVAYAASKIKRISTHSTSRTTIELTRTLTSNVFSIGWTASGANTALVIIQEAAYS